MKKMNVMRLVLTVALASLLAVGCATTPATPTDTSTQTQTQTQPADTGVTTQDVTEDVSYKVSDLTRVHFDFDSYVLTPKARRTLARNAEVLKALGIKVQIEGHCDERGSDEYNLALGERRAQAAMNYLATLGVPSSRMSTISYGEEKALDPGHDEAAWAKNRRAEFVAK